MIERIVPAISTMASRLRHWFAPGIRSVAPGDVTPATAVIALALVRAQQAPGGNDGLARLHPLQSRLEVPQPVRAHIGVLFVQYQLDGGQARQLEEFAIALLGIRKEGVTYCNRGCAAVSTEEASPVVVSARYDKGSAMQQALADLEQWVSQQRPSHSTVPFVKLSPQVQSTVLAAALFPRLRFREQHPDPFSLAGFTCDGANMQYANLHKASLAGANLGYLDCRNTNLSGADLTDICWTSADFRGANLKGATLTFSKDYIEKIVQSAGAVIEKTLESLETIGSDYKAVRTGAIRSLVDGLMCARHDLIWAPTELLTELLQAEYLDDPDIVRFVQHRLLPCKLPELRLPLENGPLEKMLSLIDEPFLQRRGLVAHNHKLAHLLLDQAAQPERSSNVKKQAILLQDRMAQCPVHRRAPDSIEVPEGVKQQVARLVAQFALGAEQERELGELAVALLGVSYGSLYCRGFYGWSNSRGRGTELVLSKPYVEGTPFYDALIQLEHWVSCQPMTVPSVPFAYLSDQVQARVMARANFKKIRMRPTDAANITFQGVSCDEAVFSDVDLRQTSFKGARFGDVYWIGADLRGVDLSNIIWNSANFRDARMEGAKLSFSPEFIQEIANSKGRTLDFKPESPGLLHALETIGDLRVKMDAMHSLAHGLGELACDLSRAPGSFFYTLLLPDYFADPVISRIVMTRWLANHQEITDSKNPTLDFRPELAVLLRALETIGDRRVKIDAMRFLVQGLDESVYDLSQAPVSFFDTLLLPDYLADPVISRFVMTHWLPDHRHDFPGTLGTQKSNLLLRAVDRDFLCMRGHLSSNRASTEFLLRLANRSVSNDALKQQARRIEAVVNELPSNLGASRPIEPPLGLSVHLREWVNSSALTIRQELQLGEFAVALLGIRYAGLPYLDGIHSAQSSDWLTAEALPSEQFQDDLGMCLAVSRLQNWTLNQPLKAPAIPFADLSAPVRETVTSTAELRFSNDYLKRITDCWDDEDFEFSLCLEQLNCLSLVTATPHKFSALRTLLGDLVARHKKPFAKDEFVAALWRTGCLADPVIFQLLLTEWLPSKLRETPVRLDDMQIAQLLSAMDTTFLKGADCLADHEVSINGLLLLADHYPRNLVIRRQAERVRVELNLDREGPLVDMNS